MTDTTRDQRKVIAPLKVIVTLAVMDLNGRVVLIDEMVFESGKVNSDVEHLDAGMYMLSNTMSDGQSNQVNIVKL